MVEYKEVRESVKSRIKGIVDKGKVKQFIFKFKDLESRLEGWDFHGFPIENLKYNPNHEVIMVSTLDSESLDKETMSDNNYNYLFFNRGKKSDWEGLTLYSSDNYLEIYDDTCGLHFSIFLLF